MKYEANKSPIRKDKLNKWDSETRRQQNLQRMEALTERKMRK